MGKLNNYLDIKFHQQYYLIPNQIAIPKGKAP